MKRISIAVFSVVVATAAFFALGGCAAGSLVAYRVAPDYPRSDSTRLQLEGLSQPVHVLYDKLGVPHIEAQNTLDLMRAVGFAQGRDRFFEMDMMRRFARGRVAELVGEQPLFAGTTVDFDRSMRGWELGERAEEITRKMSAEERAQVETYCAGVNAAVAKFLPLEYRLLRVTPEPWSPEDVWVVGLLNAWTVSHNWQQELTRFSIALAVGPDRAEAIYPNEPLEGGWTLPGDGHRRDLPPAIVPEMRALLLERMKPAAIPGPAPRTELESGDPRGLTMLAGASNAWVVSGARSVSGKPVLASDPHLSHLLPSIAYQQHLKAPGLDVIGITIPGLPWVLMGHNERVSWGITSTVADVMDLVVEKPDPAHVDRVLHEGGECPLESREVVIRVKDGAPRTMHLRRTCNGPVLNDMVPTLLPEGSPLVAVRWQVAGVERSLAALEQADRARTVEDLRLAAESLMSPIQTFTAADVDGHIATFVSGQIPLRTAHRGTFPIPGWLHAYEWSGLAAGDALPHAIDPESGYFAHSNNLMVDPRETDVPVNVDAAPPYRRQRVVERLLETPKHDVSTLAAIQRDVKLERAARIIPRMLEDLRGFTPRSDTDREALKLLASWNFEAPASSQAAAIFWLTYRHAVLEAIDDELPRPAVEFFMSQRYSTNVADGWFDRVDHPIWTTSRTVAVRKAFAEAVDDLVAEQGAKPDDWRWGRLHYVEPRHPFGGKSALADLVNLPRTEAGGALDSVWKSHFDIGDEKAPFRAMAGPVYRMVIDLADVNHAQWVLDTGASGWPGSPHYGDQFKLWKTGQLAPMLFDAKEIHSASEGDLELSP